MNDEHVTYCRSKWIQPYSSNGDVYDGPGKPGPMPWSACADAPFFAFVPGSRRIRLYDGRGSTGYSKTNLINWVDDEPSQTMVCGKGGNGEGLDGSALFWNANH